MSRKQQLADLTSHLVSYKSISANLVECDMVTDYVMTLFAGKGYFVSRYESEGVPSIIISRKREHNYRLLFNGHLDVVPAPDEAFHPRVENGRLYGRGTADMKGSCAVMIQFFLDHAEDRLLDDCALMLTADEEVGGTNGVGYLVEEVGVKAEVIFVPDGGGALVPCIFEKGIQHARLEAKGKPAHGSRPWLGDSAVDKLLDDLSQLRKRFQRVSVDNQWDISLNIGRIGGGKTANLVADKATAELDFRFPAGLSLQELRKAIRETVTHSTLQFLGYGEAVSVDEDLAEYRLFCEVLEQFGGSRQGIPEHGTSDARWFVEQGSIILITKPLGSAYHIDDEWVDIEGLDTFYKVIDTYTHRLLHREQKAAA